MSIVNVEFMVKNELNLVGWIMMNLVFFSLKYDSFIAQLGLSYNLNITVVYIYS